jgi:fructosamine-3-kinase
VTDVLTATLAAVVGHDVRIQSRQPLGGGDISLVERVRTTHGTFVVKTHPAPPEGFFAAEAAGLAALAASGTTLRIAAVIAVRDAAPALVVLEDLGSGRGQNDVDEAVGAGLAALHRCGAKQFGFQTDTFCGSTRQPNEWAGSWVEFFGERRLRYQVALAARAGRLSPTESRRLDGLIDRLDTIIDEPPEGPALVHGDLWSGNLHIAADGRPALIDPAVAFAHREAELGMMTLFGGFNPRVYDAYAAAFPLEPGWRERNPIYRLYHLLNHLNLFGETYRGQVMAVVRHFT